MATNTLVIPFLDDDPKYAIGVEFGMLYRRMNDAQPGEEIADYFTVENQEQITLTANRLKWEVVKMEPWGRQWVWIRLRKQ